jgi:hypothetical protein
MLPQVSNPFGSVRLRFRPFTVDYLNFHVAEIEGGTSTIPLVLLQGTRILDAV